MTPSPTEEKAWKSAWEEGTQKGYNPENGGPMGPSSWLSYFANGGPMVPSSSSS
jgi:hypothetical protein